MDGSDRHALIDLHVHSSASDGSLTPSELVHRAQHLGLAALAITDHDTLDGVRSLLATGPPQGMGFVTGVEISAAAHPDYPCFGSLHILGYGIRSEDSHLQNRLERLQEARRQRNPQIIARLNALGIAITMEDVAVFSEDGQIGRPHIARALVARGVATDIDEAFDRLLGTGRPAYVEKYRLPCREALDTIRGAGGVAVLAHPALIKPRGTWRLDEMVARLKDEGLQGLEVYYSSHTAKQSRRFRKLAAALGLLATGGSDFHGAVTPDLEMGTGRGDLRVPFALYERLMAALAPSRIRGPAANPR